MKKILLLPLITPILCVTFFNTMHAMRTGLTRKEAMQARHVAIKQACRLSRISAHAPLKKVGNRAIESTQVSPFTVQEMNENFEQLAGPSYEHVYCRPLRLSRPTIRRTLACAFIVSLLIQSAQAAILDGQLGPTADKAGRFIKNYQELEESHPVEAKMAVSGSMILAKGFVGAVIGAVATAPVGGEGAIPGFAYGVIKGLGDEVRNVAIGKVVHAVANDKIEIFLQQAVDSFAPTLMALDSKLTWQQAKQLSVLVACSALSSTELAFIIKGMGHIDLSTISFSTFKSEFSEIAKTYGKTLKDFARHDLMQGAAEGMNGVTMEDLLGSKALGYASPNFQAPAASKTSSSFMAEGLQIMGHQAYLQGQLEHQSDPLHLGLPSERPIDYKFNDLPGFKYGAAASESFNEQYRKKVMGF